MSESMLAAVAAAAEGAHASSLGGAAVGGVPTGMLPAVNPAIVGGAAPAAVDLAAIRAEAAAAERARITAIDALALKGCEDIVAKAKADGLSPGDAALAIVGKIKADGMLDAVQAMKASAATVPPIDADASADGTRADAAAPKAAEGPETWKAEYAANAKISAEFLSADDYVAWRRREVAHGR